MEGSPEKQVKQLRPINEGKSYTKPDYTNHKELENYSSLHRHSLAKQSHERQNYTRINQVKSQEFLFDKKENEDIQATLI